MTSMLEGLRAFGRTQRTPGAESEQAPGIFESQLRYSSANRELAVIDAMQMAMPLEKVALAKLAMSLLDTHARAELVRELDREMWKAMKP